MSLINMSLNEASETKLLYECLHVAGLRTFNPYFINCNHVLDTIFKKIHNMGNGGASML